MNIFAVANNCLCGFYDRFGLDWAPGTSSFPGDVYDDSRPSPLPIDFHLLTAALRANCKDDNSVYYSGMCNPCTYDLCEKQAEQIAKVVIKTIEGIRKDSQDRSGTLPIGGTLGNIFASCGSSTERYCFGWQMEVASAIKQALSRDVFEQNHTCFYMKYMQKILTKTESTIG